MGRIRKELENRINEVMRDRMNCECCNCGSKLTMHHITPYVMQKEAIQ